MLPAELKERLEAEIRHVEHPRELAVDVMFAIQEHYGHLHDEALAEAAALLGMTSAAGWESARVRRPPTGCSRCCRSAAWATATAPRRCSSTAGSTAT
jgi:hypothetical protein